jgi:accessory gene regulator protein AgrB
MLSAFEGRPSAGEKVTTASKFILIHSLSHGFRVILHNFDHLAKVLEIEIILTEILEAFLQFVHLRYLSFVDLSN